MMDKRTNPPKRQRLHLVCMTLALLAAPCARAAGPWDQPTAQLAAKIAEILGAGQVQLVLTNRSSIAPSEIAPIRHLIEQDLHTRGVGISGSESANLVRITLSENSRERLWVAEIVEGNQTQVAMIHFEREPISAKSTETGLILEKKRLWTSKPQDGPILAALETSDQAFVLELDQIVFLNRTPAGWQEQNRWNLGQVRAQSRDPRGLIIAAPDGNSLTIVTPGRQCTANRAASPELAKAADEWKISCQESDDPWPVTTNVAAASSKLNAFYNASRNYFTGVFTPNPGADLPPFYSLIAIPHPTDDRPALLLTGLNGTVQMMDGDSLKPVAGTRDWGSDIASLHPNCGFGTQILTSASGEAENDSLRAFEMPSQEAVAVSAPLDMGGTITSLSTSPDGASALAIIRKSTMEYEVDRVTALCP